jgi:hypothetical protein
MHGANWRRFCGKQNAAASRLFLSAEMAAIGLWNISQLGRRTLNDTVLRKNFLQKKHAAEIFP